MVPANNCASSFSDRSTISQKNVKQFDGAAAVSSGNEVGGRPPLVARRSYHDPSSFEESIQNSSSFRSGTSAAGSTVVVENNKNNGKKPRDTIKEEQRIKKSRKILGDYLNRLGEVNGRSLSLNQDTGTCSFPHERFLFVIELPQDQPKTMYMYTCVCRLEEQDNITKVAQTAMELNYLQGGTKGSTLGMRSNEEINLCRSIPLKALNPTKLRMALDEFIVTASEVHAKLERAKRAFVVSTMEMNSRMMTSRRSRKPQHVRSRTFTT